MSGKSKEFEAFVRHYNLDKVLLVSVLAMACAITLLDFTGALDSIPWLYARITTLTLLSIGLVAGYIIIERREQFQKVSDGLESLRIVQENSARAIIESLGGIEVKSFENSGEFLLYLSQQVREAEEQICEMMLQPDLGVGNQWRDLLEKYLEDKERASEDKEYREIYAMNRDSATVDTWFKRLSKGSRTLLCAYYDPEIVPFRFIIIDNFEVVIFGNVPIANLAVRHAGVAKLFKAYFSNVWERSRKLLVNGDPDWSNIAVALGTGKKNLLEKLPVWKQ